MLKRLLFAVVLLTSVRCATPAPQPGLEPEPEVSAGVDKEKIRRVIREHLVPVKHCYEKELKVNPKIEGKLVLAWDIGDLGKVTHVEVVKSVHPAIDSCVADSLKGWLFPTPVNGAIVKVKFPFLFSAGPYKAK